jgi:hypothetical protein
MEPATNVNVDVNKLPLRAMGLRPGMALQTRRLVEGATKKESQYFGAIDGKGVMVGPLGSEGTKTELIAGEVCIVRGFTGQYEFSFLSKVLQTFERPFAYALLAYPASVDARLVRKSMRTNVSWPTQAAVLNIDGTVEPALEVTLVDISSSGAMFKALANVAPIGSELVLTMAASLEDTPVELKVKAAICHNNRATYEDAYIVGVAFKGLTPQDKLVLHYLSQPTKA